MVQIIQLFVLVKEKQTNPTVVEILLRFATSTKVGGVVHQLGFLEFLVANLQKVKK